MTERKLRAANQVVHGALLLGLATVISKLLGTLQKIPLQNIGGDGVFGIYNTVYPFYVLLTAIASAGIPIAVARLVAELEILGDRRSVVQMTKAGCLLMGLSGVVGFVLMYAGSADIARWIGNSLTTNAIRASSFALLVVPIMAVLRGYSQGRGDMVSTAVSQVVEQFARVTVMIVLLVLLTKQGAADELIAAGATFGSFAGGVCGLLILLPLLSRKHKGDRIESANQLKNASNELPLKSISYWMKRLARTALPICLGAIVVPFVNVVDVFTVPRLMTEYGLTETESMVQFGVYSRALPLVQLVTMVATSLAVGLVPALAEAKRVGAETKLYTTMAGAMRTAWIVGSAAAVGLAVLARPINTALYTDDRGTMTFVLVSCTALAGTVQAVSTAMLQGVGILRAPAFNLLAASAVKIALNIALVPMWGINGAAVAGLAALTAAAWLNSRALARYGGLPVAAWLERPLRLAVALAAMGLAAWLIAAAFAPMGGRLGALTATLVAVPLGALLFAALAARLQIVRPEEWAAVPRIGPRLAALAARWARSK
ncbi:putative polysaccharide biosynthesis protein [Paenibacillus marinisediminis]